MRKRVSMLVGLVVVILSELFFVACGGGGGGSTQTGSVSLFFTDSPADVYSSVLVKVYEVNLCILYYTHHIATPSEKFPLS